MGKPMVEQLSAYGAGQLRALEWTMKEDMCGRERALAAAALNAGELMDWAVGPLCAFGPDPKHRLARKYCRMARLARKDHICVAQLLDWERKALGWRESAAIGARAVLRGPWKALLRNKIALSGTVPSFLAAVAVWSPSWGGTGTGQALLGILLAFGAAALMVWLMEFVSCGFGPLGPDRKKAIFGWALGGETMGELFARAWESSKGGQAPEYWPDRAPDRGAMDAQSAVGALLGGFKPSGADRRAEAGMADLLKEGAQPWAEFEKLEEGPFVALAQRGALDGALDRAMEGASAKQGRRSL